MKTLRLTCIHIKHIHFASSLRLNYCAVNTRLKRHPLKNRAQLFKAMLAQQRC